MSWLLFKDGVKSSWKPFVIFTAVMSMYFAIIATMFDPEMGAALKEFEKAMPELMAMMGMSDGDSSLIGFIASYLYGFIVPVIPMVYAIIMGNSLVAKRVDSGSMAYLLAAPVPRLKIVLTQMCVLVTGVFLMLSIATVLGITTCHAYFPGELDTGKFLLLNLGALALHICISGICFFASCLFSETRYSLAAGAGIPALCYIIQMIANAGDKLENAKYATFFTLFNPNSIIAGESSAHMGLLVLIVAGVVLYTLACVVFTRKDIPV